MSISDPYHFLPGGRGAGVATAVIGAGMATLGGAGTHKSVVRMCVFTSTVLGRCMTPFHFLEKSRIHWWGVSGGTTLIIIIITTYNLQPST